MVLESNLRVLRAGYNYAWNLQHMTPRYVVHPALIEKGLYRNVNGNLATAWGLLAAAEKAGLELLLVRILLRLLLKYYRPLPNEKIWCKSFQAEDEIAGICTSIGAAFAGDLAVTSTSGPGFALNPRHWDWA